MLKKKPYLYFIVITVCLILSSVFIPKKWFKKTYFSEAPKNNSGTISETIRLAYGLPIDSFEIHKGIVKRNVVFGDILSEFSVSVGIVRQIEQAAEGIIDFRKIKAGNIFAFLKPKSPDNKALYFVYEHTPTEYYFVEITDSITVEKREKDIQTYHKTVSGIINTSLWGAMQDQQINPMIAIELSEIFAWSIDFFGLQKGDAFKLIYDEQFVDTISVGIGQIHGAWFKHAGREFVAIPFIQDGEVEFFDAEGKSLRKAFLKAPLRFSRISSRFSGNRFHPVLNRYTTHYGVDYAAPVGTPVVAIGDGTVVSAGWNGGAGNMVKIRHNSVYTTGYMHLRSFGAGVRVGAYVRQGEIIGYVGSTGLSTGPHLDFRVWRNNSPINPLTMESPSVEPVDPKKIEEFNGLKNMVIAQLNNIDLPGPKGTPIDVKIYALRDRNTKCEAY